MANSSLRAPRAVAECFKLLNLDRHEFLDPEGLGWEAAGSRRGRGRLLEALAILISVGEDDGDGVVYGRWCGERIVLIGKKSDPVLYRWVASGKSVRDLSALVRVELDRRRHD